MFPYWLLFSIFAAGSLQYSRTRPVGEQANPLLAVAALFVALMIGFRFRVGGDWVNYEDIYFWSAYMELPEALASSDPGYTLLNWIGQQLGVQIWFVNMFCGLVFAWGLARFARRQANPWLAILVAVPYLVIVVAMGYTRQGVAIGFILAGLAVLDRSSVLRFCGYIALAVVFHKSAVIVLPLVAMAATRNKILITGLLLVTAALLYYLFVVASIDSMMAAYIGGEMTSQGAAIRVAMNLPPALIFLLSQRRFNLDSQQRKLWRNFSYAAFAAFALLIWLSEANTVVDRLALYLIPLQIFVFSNLPVVFPDRKRANMQIVCLILAYSAAIQFVWLNYAQHADHWIPYRLYPLTESY